MMLRLCYGGSAHRRDWRCPLSAPPSQKKRPRHRDILAHLGRRRRHVGGAGGRGGWRASRFLLAAPAHDTTCPTLVGTLAAETVAAWLGTLLAASTLSTSLIPSSHRPSLGHRGTDQCGLC